MDPEKKSALVSGAGNGIGAATARWLRDKGYGTLVLLDLSPQAVERVAEELRGGDDAPRIFCCTADISRRDALQAALRPVLAEIGRIDLLVNSAGIADENEPEQADIWQRVLDVNLNGTYHVTLEALNAMPDGGRIVNVSSVLGRAGKRRNTAYCTSKHALLGFTKSLALDLAPRRITVNAVLPAWIDTPMLRHEVTLQADSLGLPPEQLLRNARKQIPLRRFLAAREVASLIGFLASDDAAGITAQSYTIDGGFTCGV